MAALASTVPVTPVTPPGAARAATAPTVALRMSNALSAVPDETGLADYMPDNWGLICTYWQGIRTSLLCGQPWTDEGLFQMRNLLDQCAAVTEKVTETMMYALDCEEMMFTGLPCTFNPGLMDCCWSTESSWSAPWAMPTLRTLMRMKIGDAGALTANDLFAELRPWTTPRPLLAVKDAEVVVLKMGTLPEAVHEQIHCGWICLPVSTALLFSEANRISLDASWPLSQSNISASPAAALTKAIHWRWQQVNVFMTDEPLAMLMLWFTEAQKANMKLFNRRYVDWMWTVQSEFHVAESLRAMTTVIQLTDVYMKPLAKALSQTLNLVASHSGLRRGLLGHCTCCDVTMRKLEETASSWNDQFGSAEPATVSTAKLTKKKKITEETVDTDDDATEIIIKIRKGKH